MRWQSSYTQNKWTSTLFVSLVINYETVQNKKKNFDEKNRLLFQYPTLYPTLSSQPLH